MLPIRPNIEAMRPYSPGKPIEEVQREFGLTSVIKLASNENPLGPSPKAVAAVERAAREMHIYPDASAYNLVHAIARKFSVPPDQVLLGNGSDELIHYLGLVFLTGNQDEIIVGDPSFVRYDATAQVAGAKIVKVPLDGNLRHDVMAMADAVSDRTRMIWIANPNNPTGTIISRAELDDLLARTPKHVVIVLDEAYAEYAMGEPTYPVSTDYLETGRVVGLRTMSKAYGLAGIRLGYGFAPFEVADAINRARQPFNVNSLAQAAALTALEDQEHLARSVATNRAAADRLMEVFQSVGARPVRSFANFVCADMGRPGEPIFHELLKRGVIVRSGHVLGLPNYLRVSCGTLEEVNAFADALSEVVRLASV